MSDEVYCADCRKNVEPDYVTRSCVAMYGSVVFAKGLCPECGRTITRELMIDDDGVREPKY